MKSKRVIIIWIIFALLEIFIGLYRYISVEYYSFIPEYIAIKNILFGLLSLLIGLLLYKRLEYLKLINYAPIWIIFCFLAGIIFQLLDNKSGGYATDLSFILDFLYPLLSIWTLKRIRKVCEVEVVSFKEFFKNNLKLIFISSLLLATSVLILGELITYF